MNPKVLPAPREPRSPTALSLHEALDRSEPLAALGARLRDSAARLEAIRPSLPPGLERQVSAGPVDETGWSLLVSSPAVSAKLRQLKPRLEQALRDAGWAVHAIRIKVRHPDPRPLGDWCRLSDSNG
jgi:hypothetical protein